MIAVALLLAQDLPMPAGIGLRFTFIEDPFGWIPALSGRIESQPRVPIELSAHGMTAVGEWITALAQHHHRSMNVALRRTLSSHERVDPTDAFIDALIAWDSLFGARSGDAVTFRVAVGFALLLGDTERNRREIRRQAQALYALRSNLLHGTVPELPVAGSIVATHKIGAISKRHAYGNTADMGDIAFILDFLIESSSRPREPHTPRCGPKPFDRLGRDTRCT